MTISELISSLSDNPYFGAGFGLFGVGTAAAILKKSSAIGFIVFRRHCMTTVEVTCKDKSYNWLLQWITEKGARKTQHLSLETAFKQAESGKVETQFHFVPSPGMHVFRYCGSWLRVERIREQRMGEPWEAITLTCLGNKKNIFEKMILDARELAIRAYAGKTITYTCLGAEWRQFGHPNERRSIDSVILDGDMSEKIVRDVKAFVKNEKWYRDRGIPYRRGYLLHGPPGCGKSSFISALAGELEYSISVLNLSDRGLSDDRFLHRLADAPENSLILLEDVDAAFVSREETPEMKLAYQGLNRLTFSGLLNALDGVTSSEGRILFMTTNYKERLDPALIRPGRVDMQAYIGYCTQNQARLMFQKFYPEESEELAREFISKANFDGENISVAQVQAYFMFFINDPISAVKNAKDIKMVS